MEDWLDKFRVFSLLFIFFACYMTYDIGNWFMSLETPNNAQAGFAGTFGLALVGMLKYYIENRLNK